MERGTMTAPIYLPRSVIEKKEFPNICSLHGTTALKEQKIVVTSDPPTWVYVLMFISLLPALIVMAIIQIKVPTVWHVCNVCINIKRERTRQFWMTYATVPLLLGATLVAAPYSHVVATGLGITTVVALLTAIVLTLRASWTAILNLTVDRGSHSIKIKNPHTNFVNALPQPN